MKRIVVPLWLALAAASGAQTPATTFKFDFGPEKPAPGYTKVLPTTGYTDELGYGFEPGSSVTAPPFYFSVKVPEEGNYKVTVTFGDRQAESITTVKAEIRRLMVEKVRTAPGKFETRSFIVNVRTPKISTGGEVRLKDREKTSETRAWDDKLTLEFIGQHPAVSKIEIEKADNIPTIYIAGDSTSTDQSREPFNSWGQMLPRFFKPDIAVANHGESGESLRGFIGERRLDKVMSVIKPGDYLFIQMGHNDQKERGEGVGAFTTYKADLKRFVAETRQHGATPVLVTPMNRLTFDANGKITNSLGDYPEAVRQVGKEENAAVIDLNAMSKPFYEALGPVEAHKAFAGNDTTHHSDYGSYELAKCIVEGIKQDKLPLVKYLTDDVRDTPFDPAHPDPIASFDVPAEPGGNGPRPYGDTGPAGAPAPGPEGAPAPPQGPFEPNWASIQAHYEFPQWFRDGKFGIFLHWGLYAVPAHQSEWYVQHMYGNPEIIAWHKEHFGPQDIFGYKDFIPLFTAAKFDPDQWAELFRKAGARYVMPTAEHHDGFAMWASALTKWNAKQMGPKRDLIGDLAKAVRKQGMKFGVSNHRMEHFTFIRPQPGLATDLYDPRWADFYSVADRSPEARQKFLDDWVARNFELIDKYQPDLLYFDNGVNGRDLDPQKLKVAAYYYNRATEWKKQVSIVTKDAAYLAGTIKDYERQMRGPTTIEEDPWEVDDSVHQRWGYLSDAHYWNVSDIVWRLVENVSKNGNLLLNFSPRADGTIPDEQVKLMLGIGQWLDVNGEAIYESRPWIKFGEGEAMNNKPAYTGKDIRFTTKSDTLYAILMAWPGERAVVTSLAVGNGKIAKVEMLGHKGDLKFTQDAEGLKVAMPAEQPCQYAFTLKITGLKL